MTQKLWPDIIWNLLKKLKVLVCYVNISFVYIYIYTGCPRILRADHGTENVIVAQLQIAFRMEHNDRLAGAKSFIYGPSTANIVCTYL